MTSNVNCRFCQKSDTLKKHGKGANGHQRYRCTSCNKTFQSDYSYEACKPGKKEKIEDLTRHNEGIRGTARALNVSINTVVRAVKRNRAQHSNAL
ncbi:IS1-like element transposase [Vibrio sp. SS-MA-C1-2]|uniref:IS1-like element transposase n=1 Tax=Vibrio sp. SS-MA-C1-2 TaxID=2908646 RepID=UPI001F404328|nr:IS1-like element transposase [Vibrio sp. SS-MA-C1-2]UJF17136.1 IS1-like element transposase [Vibrio sp. SS-MA-C1-2]